MAPEIVEPKPAPKSSFPKSLAGPKEAFIGGPQAYNKTAEENGTESQPAASYPNYLPVWDAETKYESLLLEQNKLLTNN